MEFKARTILIRIEYNNLDFSFIFIIDFIRNWYEFHEARKVQKLCRISKRFQASVYFATGLIDRQRLRKISFILMQTTRISYMVSSQARINDIYKPMPSFSVIFVP